MVGHEYPRVYIDTKARCGFNQPVGIRLEIRIRSETGLAVVAALDDVDLQAGRTGSRDSGHQ